MKNFFKRSRAVKRLLGKRPRHSKFSFERFPTRSIEPLEMRVVLDGDPLTGDSAWYDSSSIDLSVRCMLASSAGDSSGVSALNAEGGGGGGGDVNPLVEDPTVTFRLEAQNTSDAPISTITVGQDFQVAVFVQDTRDPESAEAGVFAAYLNVFYGSSLASVNTSQSIEYGPGFTLTQTGTLSTAGQIVAAGAARGSLDAPGNDEQLLFRVTVHADAAGILHLTSTFDGSPGHQTLVFLDDDLVPQEEIEFGTLDLPILSTEQQSLSISNATVTEGTSEQNDTPAVFTVTLSAPYVNEVTVGYSTAADTASDSSDFLPTSGTLTFAPGEVQKLVTVMVNADAIDEIDEQFNLLLADPVSATVSDGTGSGTITDDDNPPTISVADTSTGEGSTMTFTVSLSAASGKEITVVVSTANDTASENDYGADTGTTITFAPGETSQLVTVNTTGDSIDEFDETFALNLSAPVNVTLGDASGTGTIIDDDEPPTVSIGDVTQAEGSSGTTAFVFTVSLSGQSGKPVTVQYATADDSATDPDYLSTSGTVTFAAGETQQLVTVLVNGDTLDEQDEVFVVNLSNATNASLDDASGAGTIDDDDAPPEVSISNIVSHLEGDEGTTAYVFTISLSSASGKVVTVQYGTNDLGDSTQDTDYVGTTATLTFLPGQPTQQLVTVLVNGDTAIEENETFRLVLLDANNASVNTEPPGGLGTIINDDGPHISFVVDQVSQTEGDSGTKTYVFTVTIGEADNENPVTVAYTTVDDGATAGSDYAGTSGTLTFAPGTLTQTVTVLVNGDDDDESDESFKLVLSDASSNATFAETTATGVIQNDDDVLIAFNPEPVSQAEGNTNNQMLFTVTLSHATQQTVSVEYDTQAGSATAGTDYQTTSGTLVFAPGVTSQIITVTILGDLSDEPNEGFGVRLFNSVNAENALNLEDALDASGTIEDDDPVPTLTIAPISLPEANSGTTAYVFTATLSQASGKTIEVAFQTSDGTATTANSDYTQRTGTLTFAPGETQRTFTVFTLGDAIFEQSETFNLNLTALDANVTLANATVVNTIQNDDPLPTLQIFNANSIEGNSGTQNVQVAVTLSNPTSTPVTVTYTTASGTAISGVDFQSKTGTLTFAPGETQQMITVVTIGDVFNEIDEAFTITLSNVAGATLGNAVSNVSIANNDALPAITISDLSTGEGDSGLTPFVFVVTMNPASGQVVTVEFAVSSGTATVGSDFQATNGTLTFQPGETSKLITVNVIGDLLKEADENFTVNLFNAINATTFNFDGQGTIQNGSDTLVISPSTLSGFAFVDSDGDNKVDIGEIPLAGTLVTLTGTRTGGGSVNMTTAANITGFYSFTGLDPGTYSVSFDVTAGKFTNTAVKVGDQGGSVLSSQLGYTSTVAASVTGQNNNLTVKNLAAGFISQRLYLSSFDSVDKAKEFASSTEPASQNTFIQTGNVLNIRGTSGNDTFEFKSGATLTVTLNGQTKTYDPASVSQIYYDGLGGDDSANLVGSLGTDIATQGLGFASLAGTNYTIHANNISRIRVDGGGGTDTATLQDSAIGDSLITSGSQASLENDLDQLALILAFEQVTANSSAGGTDIATSNQINYALSKTGNWINS